MATAIPPRSIAVAKTEDHAWRGRTALFPGFGSEFDLVGAGEKRPDRFEDHATLLFS